MAKSTSDHPGPSWSLLDSPSPTVGASGRRGNKEAAQEERFGASEKTCRSGWLWKSLKIIQRSSPSQNRCFGSTFRPRIHWETPSDPRRPMMVLVEPILPGWWTGPRRVLDVLPLSSLVFLDSDLLPAASSSWNSVRMGGTFSCNLGSAQITGPNLEPASATELLFRPGSLRRFSQQIWE